MSNILLQICIISLNSVLIQFHFVYFQQSDDLKRAIEESLKESRNHLANKGRMEQQSAPPQIQVPSTTQEKQPPKQEEALIDFFSDPAPMNNQTLNGNSNALV
jgi:hypothetical protein